MIQTDNLNIVNFEALSPPAIIKGELPLTSSAADTVVAGRADIRNILSHRDPRFLVIAGPCSIHDREGALAYARKLRELGDEVSDRIVTVMRVYFEKPRTTLGWKGLIYDPLLDGSDDIEKGLRLAREILLRINELGLPAATEILEPVIPQYITDLVSWAAIGARTAESQTHRQMASGLSMPIGFKNATDGSTRVAIEAIRTASSPHSFIGITNDGRAGLFRTGGNVYGHLVLRGGANGPNYEAEYIAYSRELMRRHGLVPNVIVDCSHGNSRKRADRQPAVVRNVVSQHVSGAGDCIVGVMLESNLTGGRQPFPETGRAATTGVSVTDDCLGWEETAACIREVYESLAGMRT